MKKPMSPQELKEQCKLWGLGRGVNIITKTPWMDKTSFQVRSVRSEDLVVTDEGGLLKGYSDVVNNSTTVHSQIRANAEAPLTIGVDSEYSRTDCSSKHVVGLKVKNRTVSFRVDFDDLPKSWVEDCESARKDMILSQSERETAMLQEVTDGSGEAVPSASKQHDIPFEGSLCKWLAECLEHRGIRAMGITNPYELLNLELKEGSEKRRLIESDEHAKLIKEGIRHFIEHLGVTHYVSAIELGGLHFSILTEKEYEKKVAASGNASLNSQLYGGIEATATHSRL